MIYRNKCIQGVGGIATELEGPGRNTLTRRQLLAAAAATAAPGAGRLSVLLDWFINPDHAPLLVAQRSGAFTRAGLAVELVPPADASMAPKLVAAGHGDIALTDQPHFHEQIAGGLNLVRVGALIDRPLSTLVALRRSGIATLRDLRGKRIGHGSGDAERAMVAAMLATVHLTPDDVQMVNVGEQLTIALMAEEVDAVTVYRNFEVLELKAQGADPLQFDYETHGVPWFDEMIFVTAPRLAADPRLPRFLRAVREATAMLRADPAGTWKNCSSASPDLDTDLNHAAWAVTIPYFAQDPATLNVARYDAFAAFLSRAGIIPAPPPARDYTRAIGI